MPGLMGRLTLIIKAKFLFKLFGQFIMLSVREGIEIEQYPVLHLLRSFVGKRYGQNMLEVIMPRSKRQLQIFFCQRAGFARTCRASIDMK